MPLYRDRNLHIVFGVSLMAVLGASSVTPAFPRMVEELNLVPQRVGLLITMFTLPGVFLSPVLGVLSDRFGRKTVLVPMLMVFGVAGAACALVSDFGALLALRFVQGIGAASLGVMSLTLVGDLYEGRDRIVAMGYNSGIMNAGMSFYPILGGVLATFGWRYPFALPLLAIPIALVILYFMEVPVQDKAASLREYLGSVWSHTKSPVVAGLFLASVATTLVRFGPILTYLPLFMSLSFGSSPFLIGLMLASSAFVTVLTAVQIGPLTMRFSSSGMIKAAFAMYTVALILIPLSPNSWWLLLSLVILGVANGINMPNVNTMITEISPPENRGMFLAVNGMMFRLGQTLGPLVMGASTLALGIGGAFYIVAAGTLAICFATLILIR